MRLALLDRHALLDADLLGDVLAYHDLHHRPLDHVGDREEALALRGGAQEDRTGGKGEVRAAREHRVRRGDADEIAEADVEPLLLEEAHVLGDKHGRKGQRLRRQRHRHVDVLAPRRSRRDSEQRERRQENSQAPEHLHPPRIVVLRMLAGPAAPQQSLVAGAALSVIPDAPQRVAPNLISALPRLPCRLARPG
jgi:hypothetical protein